MLNFKHIFEIEILQISLLTCLEDLKDVLNQTNQQLLKWVNNIELQIISFNNLTSDSTVLIPLRVALECADFSIEDCFSVSILIIASPPPPIQNLFRPSMSFQPENVYDCNAHENHK